MAQIDPSHLDHSPQMREYFEAVIRILATRHKVSPDVGRRLVDRYFAMDVDPLERALVMHRDPARLAEDLASAAH